MRVKTKAPFRFPNADGALEEAAADAEVDIPEAQYESLLAQGLIAKAKADKASK